MYYSIFFSVYIQKDAFTGALPFSWPNQSVTWSQSILSSGWVLPTLSSVINYLIKVQALSQLKLNLCQTLSDADKRRDLYHVCPSMFVYILEPSFSFLCFSHFVCLSFQTSLVAYTNGLLNSCFSLWEKLEVTLKKSC